MAVQESILESPNTSSVVDFYADQEVFVTGGTGFLGKSLLEKLLYSCPKIKKIYLLLRSKKGSPAEKRLEELKRDLVFNRIKQFDATLLDKLVPIGGDVRLLGLEMSVESMQRIANVSVVIHGAATVRFDEPLKESIIMNTRGTREVLNLARKLPKLKMFAHISTAYCNPQVDVCEEKLYPIDSDWRKIIKMAETLDLDTLETLAKKFISYHPNSYTFSKQVSEHMVNDYAKEYNLPILIHRPSIVSPSLHEPFRGWVDNFNGPVGIMIPTAFGISRILLGSSSCRLNFVPVDFVTNSVIVAIAQRVENRIAKPSSPEQDVPIFNFGMPKSKCVDINQVISRGLEEIAKFPFENMLWYPSTIITSSLLLYRIFFYIVQLLPGLFLDLILRVVGQKLSLVRLLRKIYYVQVSLLYFMTKDFDFKGSNTLNAYKQLSAEDAQTFRWFTSIDFNGYMSTSLLGAREYLMHQDPKSIPRSKIKYVIFKTIYYLLIAVIAFGTFKRLFAMTINP